MIDNEFSDPPPEGRPSAEDVLEPDQREASVDPRVGLTTELVAAVVSFAAAAGLLVLAPFLTMFTISVPGTDYKYSTDGWGRFHSATATSGSTVGHFTRFGVGLAACGIVLAVVAILIQVVGLRPGRLFFLLPGIRSSAIAFCGVAAGIMVAAGLQMSAVADTTAAALKNSSPPELGQGHPKISFTLGAGSWLALVALVVAILAVLSLRWLRAAWQEPVPVYRSNQVVDRDTNHDPDHDCEDELQTLPTDG